LLISLKIFRQKKEAYRKKEEKPINLKNKKNLNLGVIVFVIIPLLISCKTLYLLKVTKNNKKLSKYI